MTWLTGTVQCEVWRLLTLIVLSLLTGAAL